MTRWQDRTVIQTSPEDSLWCGVEVEAYECLGYRGARSYFYARAHAIVVENNRYFFSR